MTTTKAISPSQTRKLKADNRKLRAMCIVALDRLENMTSEQFALGMDRPLRELLAQVIEKTK